MPQIVVDAQVDAAYLYVSSPSEARRVAGTEPLLPGNEGGMVNLDFDADGHLIGIELIPASLYLRRQDIENAGAASD